MCIQRFVWVRLLCTCGLAVYQRKMFLWSFFWSFTYLRPKPCQELIIVEACSEVFEFDFLRRFDWTGISQKWETNFLFLRLRRFCVGLSCESWAFKNECLSNSFTFKYSESTSKYSLYTWHENFEFSSTVEQDIIVYCCLRKELEKKKLCGFLMRSLR